MRWNLNFFSNFTETFCSTDRNMELGWNEGLMLVRLLSSQSELLDRPACRAAAAILWLGPTLQLENSLPAVVWNSSWFTPSHTASCDRSRPACSSGARPIPPTPTGWPLRDHKHRPQQRSEALTFYCSTVSFNTLSSETWNCVHASSRCVPDSVCSDLWFRFCSDNKSLLIRGKPGSHQDMNQMWSLN